MVTCQYCGKECKSKLSKSCHERLCKNNPNKVDTSYLSQNAINTNNKVKEKNNKTRKYILFERICEYCGNKFYIYDIQNKKYFPKCCSSKCSHLLSGYNHINGGIKIVKCNKCNNEYEVDKHVNPAKFVCNNCKELIKIENKKRILSPESLLKLREAGKKSAKIQAENRRSKNEIEFCKLCEGYFNNVEHNKTIFNGWDADVIIHDIKFAILWNGKVHYEPIFGQANFNRVINRDKIKLKEIEKYGYIPYIIKDTNKYNLNIVQEKFNEFIEYLKQNNYIINK